MLTKARAVQFGCGPIGCSVVRYASQRPDIELVGAIDIDKNLDIYGNPELAFLCASLIEQEYAADLADMRAWALWEGDDLRGGDEWFPDGMQAITAGRV